MAKLFPDMIIPPFLSPFKRRPCKRKKTLKSAIVYIQDVLTLCFQIIALTGGYDLTLKVIILQISQIIIII